MPRLTPGALERLLSHSWPGDVDELSGLLSRLALQLGPDAGQSTVIDRNGVAAALAETSTLALPELAPDESREPALDEPATGGLESLLARQRRERAALARRTLARCKGSRSLAARLLGVSRRRLRRLLDEGPRSGRERAGRRS